MLAQQVLAVVVGVGSANDCVYVLARGLVSDTVQGEGTLVVKLDEYDGASKLPPATKTVNLWSSQRVKRLKAHILCLSSGRM